MTKQRPRPARFSLVSTILLSLTLSVSTAYSKAVQQNRFETWLDVLEEPLVKGKNGEDAAKALVKVGDSRIATFNLQALAKIYETLDKDDEFLKVKEDVKELEDAIGAVDKWTILEEKDKLKKAMKDLADLLEDKDWSNKGSSPRIEKIRKFVSQFNWPSEKKDQEFFAEQIREDLKNLEKTDFDFSVLEEGNGLHEFRRSARWFLMKARALDGGIEFKKPEDKCPVKGNSDLLKDKELNMSKYAELPKDESGKYTCKISKCLYLSVVQVVEQIGVVKDDIEKMHGDKEDDSVPSKQQKKAEKIYSDFMDRNALPTLIKEMDDCR